MMRLLLTWLVLSVLLGYGSDAATHDDLYPIVDKSLWGYVDAGGRIVIAPRFRAAEEFSEGLAAVREKGLYGFIDGRGGYAIAPRFDYAEGFRNGYAKVFLHDRPFIIDRQGSIIFRHAFKDLGSFDEYFFSIVRSWSGKFGIVDRSGRLRADTLFDEITDAGGGRFVVRQHDSMNNVDHVGIIDSAGRWIVPYGRYERIGRFIDGYAPADIVDHKYSDLGWDEIIDAAGTLVFRAGGTWRIPEHWSGFHEGLAPVIAVEDDPGAGQSPRYSLRIIDRSGAVLFGGREWQDITPFASGRAFVKRAGDGWMLIDRSGWPVTEDPFDDVAGAGLEGDYVDIFDGGIAYVKTPAGWRAIDTAGRTIARLRLPDTNIRVDRQFGSLLIVMKDSVNYSRRYGFWNGEADALVLPGYYEVDIESRFRPLVRMYRDAGMDLFDRNGRMIRRWQPDAAVRELDIDFRSVRSCAVVHDDDDYQVPESYGGSRTRSLAPGVPSGDSLCLHLAPEEPCIWNDRYRGLRIYVSNGSRRTQWCFATGGALCLTMQALDSEGLWNDLQFMPPSWCGTCGGYYAEPLDPGSYWSFIVPAYHGALRTRLRAKLVYQGASSDESSVVYSNVIEGSVNPGQFWRTLSGWAGTFRLHFF